MTRRSSMKPQRGSTPKTLRTQRIQPQRREEHRGFNHQGSKNTKETRLDPILSVPFAPLWLNPIPLRVLRAFVVESHPSPCSSRLCGWILRVFVVSPRGLDLVVPSPDQGA